METLAMVMQKEFPKVQIPFAKLSNVGRPQDFRLSGSCGDGVKIITDASRLESFSSELRAGFLLGRDAEDNDPFFALIRVFADRQYGPFYWSNGQKCWGRQPLKTIIKTATKLWWFSNCPAQTKLGEKLRVNPHFPVDERELLPGFIETKVGGGHRFDSITSSIIEKISCTTESKCLSTYCDAVPLPLRSLKQVSLSASPGDTGTDATVANLHLVFGGPSESAHALYLEDGVPPKLLCEIVKAHFPGLKRLVVESKIEDLEEVLRLVIHNKFLREMCFKSGTMGGGAMKLISECRHTEFRDKPSDVSMAWPTETEDATVPPPLPKPMTLRDFNKMCKLQKTTAWYPSLGLMTAYGQVVPLSRDLIPRFHLLKEMLSEKNEKEAEGENLVPMELNPPVWKESVALVVHFVTHYVSEEVHLFCEEAERNATPAGASYTWCPAFDDFRTVHINQRYPTSDRRVQVMCELMALACYLNCPSLKRFLRAALVMEEMSDQEARLKEEQLVD